MPQSLSNSDDSDEQARKKKAGIYLVISEKVITFAPDYEPLIWLVVQHHGFFECNSSKNVELSTVSKS